MPACMKQNNTAVTWYKKANHHKVQLITLATGSATISERLAAKSNSPTVRVPEAVCVQVSVHGSCKCMRCFLCDVARLQQVIGQPDAQAVACLDAQSRGESKWQLGGSNKVAGGGELQLQPTGIMQLQDGRMKLTAECLVV